MPSSQAASISANAPSRVIPRPKNSGADPTPPKSPHPSATRSTPTYNQLARRRHAPADIDEPLMLPQRHQGFIDARAGRGEAGGAAYAGRVRVATWNVNSVKQRVPRLLPWLDQRKPDIVCLQETKVSDDAFAELLGEHLHARGYEFASHGEARWNGVALLSKVGLTGVVRGFDEAPGFPEPEARAISATCGGIQMYSLYVPNGRVPDSDHYQYKLAWLAALRDVLSASAGAAGQQP